MCGLIGTIGFKDDSKLNLKTLSHRGPDSMGKWNSLDNEFPVALGHTRLAILDLTGAGNQPLLTEDNRFVFVFNGEIYNYKNLGIKYFSQEIGKNIPDTNVLVNLFDLKKINQINSLLDGMYAYVVHDKKKIN